MKQSVTLIWLVALILVLALVAAGAGVFWQEEGNRVTVTTLRGQTVEIYGLGLYRNDSVFKAASNRGSDTVMLVLCIPLLAVSALFYRRGSLRGGLLLIGTLAYFTYLYATMAFGVVYNELFLVYVALYALSLFAFVLAFTSVDQGMLPVEALGRAWRRGIALFLFAAGLLTSFVWLEPLISAMGQGQPPRLLGINTTMVTDALDLGIITPSTVVAGILLLRRRPSGYLLAIPLLVMLVILLPTIVSQTVWQLAAGVAFTPGEYIGPISGFLLFGLFATWLLVVMLRVIDKKRTETTETTETKR